MAQLRYELPRRHFHFRVFAVDGKIMLQTEAKYGWYCACT
jgi:hypothetical protein